MMVLSLLNPIGPDFMKDFPGQNSVNLDRIDEYTGPSLTTHPLQSFTPQLTASNTNPTLGTGGFCVGWSYQIFDQIYMWGQFRFGTGFSNGLGVYIINLPFSLNNILSSSTNLGSSPVIGNASTYDNNLNAGRLPLTVHLRTSNQLMFGTRINNGLALRELREAGYLVWDVNDGVNWCARAKKAV
jgi:hypothetical protein